MARIFGENEDQANTKRVVGTYGYMSPEYAMEGRFSEKSDVFSFGVLLLEILSGRRNTSPSLNEQSPNLLGMAWRLWTEHNMVAFIDPVIFHSNIQQSISRFMQVGLLCVQELMNDRPGIAAIISMLDSEVSDLPIPKQPAFTSNQIASSNMQLSQQSQKVGSINDITITRVEAR
ncbi:hypothetical protein CRG98_005837 [Punica granatum]|nr:hypothetical protein CRG98_005837 [Punica granatum]